MIIYTDGACSGNPGVGGWASIIINEKKEIIGQVFGREDDTTNNRMELTAVINGIKFCYSHSLKDNKSIVYTDSAYIVNAFKNNWINDWVKNFWQTSSNKPVKNIDLWKKLYFLCNAYDIEFIKVKGHSDNEYNNLCDYIATSQVKYYNK